MGKTLTRSGTGGETFVETDGSYFARQNEEGEVLLKESGQVRIDDEGRVFVTIPVVAPDDPDSEARTGYAG